MKKVLIISPYFPPSNTPDMQRVRMSLPYLKDLGWEAEIVTVDVSFSEFIKDPLLLESLPENIIVHTVGAFSKELTSKFGLGNIALRSLYFFRNKVNKLLSQQRYDLIYFSTTQFPVCLLGAYWKRRYDVPYVIDMQDPWHTDYYKNKPKHERPPKYWFSYRLNQFLEPVAMRSVGGLISVSPKYLKDLDERYSRLRTIPRAVIPFGVSSIDFEIALKSKSEIKKTESEITLVYVGVLGKMMLKSLTIIFTVFKQLLSEEPVLYNRIKFYFLGTSYAPKGEGKFTAVPLAKDLGIEYYIYEQTERISFYNALATMCSADGLIIPGTDDSGYTASKLYPCIMSKRNLFAVFHPESDAIKIINQCTAGYVVSLNQELAFIKESFKEFVRDILNNVSPETNWKLFESYTAREMSRKQCELFNEVINESN